MHFTLLFCHSFFKRKPYHGSYYITAFLVHFNISSFHTLLCIGIHQFEQVCFRIRFKIIVIFLINTEKYNGFSRMYIFFQLILYIKISFMYDIILTNLKYIAFVWKSRSPNIQGWEVENSCRHWWAGLILIVTPEIEQGQEWNFRYAIGACSLYF